MISYVHGLLANIENEMYIIFYFVCLYPITDMHSLLLAFVRPKDVSAKVCYDVRRKDVNGLATATQHTQDNPRRAHSNVIALLPS